MYFCILVKWTCSSCVRQLWNCLRIPPSAEPPAWCGFLDILALSSYTPRKQNKKSLLPSRKFYPPYVECVESIEDIWQFIGGESTPISQSARSHASFSTHIDVDSRINVLTRRITVHKSEIPSGRDTSSQATETPLIYWSKLGRFGAMQFR